MGPVTRSRDSLTVRDLPSAERPRERLIRLGAEALAEQELLACILGRGIAEASVEQLAAVHGIGPAKAVQLKAAVELARRVALASANGRRTAVDSLEAAAALLRPHLLDKPKEHVVALLLDNRHQLIRLAPIAVGSLSASLVHPRELFKEAISASAAAVIVAHNHPSGDPEPSAHDVELTRRLQRAGELLGIEVLDHVIVASRGAVSLRASGAMDGGSSMGPTSVRRRHSRRT